MEMAMDQLILYDARPSSSSHAFREVFSFADIPESAFQRDTSASRFDLPSESADSSAYDDTMTRPPRFRLHYASTPSENTLLAVRLRGPRFTIIPNAHYTIYDYLMRIFDLLFYTPPSSAAPAPAPAQSEESRSSAGETPKKETTMTIFVEFTDFLIGFPQDVTSSKSKILAFRSDLLLKCQLTGSAVTTGKYVQMMVHNMQAYILEPVQKKKEWKKGEAREEGKGRLGEREREQMMRSSGATMREGFSITLRQMKEDADVALPHADGLKWRDNYRGRSEEWKHKKYIPILLPFRLLVHYDESPKRTLCSISTGPLPLHFILNPSTDLDLFGVVLNAYGCNMIYNIWLPMKKEEEEEAIQGTGDDVAFHMSAYPPPTFPCLDYTQQLEIRTEGVQITLAELDSRGAAMGK